MASNWEDISNLDYYSDIQKNIPGINVTSGFRTPEYQEKMKQKGYNPAPNSEHLNGAKLDLVPPSGRDFSWLENEVKTLYPEAVIVNEGDHLDVRFPGWAGAPALGGAAEEGITNPNRVEGLQGATTEQGRWEVLPDDFEEVQEAGKEKSWADWGREFSSSAQTAIVDVPGFTSQVRMAGYFPLVEQLMQRGHSVNDYRFNTSGSLMPSMQGSAAQWNYNKIWEDAVAEGLIDAGDPERIANWEKKRTQVVDMLMEGKPFEEVDEAIPGFLGSREGYDYWVERVKDGYRGEVPFTGRPEGMTQEMFEEQIRANFREDLEPHEQIAANADWIPWLTGSFAGSLPDPINAIPIGAGPAGSRLRTMGIEALINMGLAGAQTPLINQERIESGRPEMTAEEVAANVGFAGAIGGTLGAATHTPLGGGSKPATRAPQGVPTRRGRPPKVNLARVQDSVKATAEGWEAAPEYVIVRNASELPEPRRAEVLEAGMEGDAKGFYSPADKKVYIIADNIERMDEVPAIVFHESLGHAGLDRQFREHLDGVMETLYRNNETVRSLVDERIASDDIYDGNIARNVEETLAERSEGGVIDSTTWEKIKSIVKQYVRKMGLNLKVTDAEVDAILARAHETVTKGTRKAEGTGDQNRFMNIGDRANRPVGRSSARVRAAAMADRGASQDEIFEATGWWKDQDGMWRERLSDIDSGLIINPETNEPRVLELAEEGTIRKLEELFDHPQLYEAYPFLRDIPVRNIDSSLGGYSPSTNTMGINVAGHRNGEFMETLLHEIQHAIQKHEGWASGGNPSTALTRTLRDEEVPHIAERMVSDLEKRRETYEEIVNSLVHYWNNPKIREYRQIFDALREAEALGFDHPEYKAWSKRYYEAGRELRKEFGDEDFRHLQNVILFDLHHPDKKLQILREEISNLDDDIEMLAQDIREGDLQELRRTVEHNREIKNEAYEWLLGEIEARETEALMHKTQAELQDVGPGIGRVEGIDPSYARITRSDDTSASMGGKVPTREAINKAAAQAGLDPNSIQAVNRARMEQYKGSSRGAMGKRDTSSLDQYIQERVWDRQVARALEEYKAQQKAEGPKFATKKGGKKGTKKGTKKQKVDMSPIGNINRKNLRTNENVAQVLRDALEEFQPEKPVTRDEIKKLARDLGVTSQDVLDDQLDMTPQRAYAYRQVMLRTGQEVVNWANRIDAGDNSDAILERFAEAFTRHAAVQEKVMKMTANAGRILNQFNIAASGRTNLAGLRTMMKDNPNLINDPESLRQLAEQVVKYKDNKPAMNKMARDAFDPKFEDYILSYWYNNVLSGLATHTANITGTSMAFIQSMADLTTAAVLGQTKRFNKQAERVMLRELGARLYGAALGFKQGVMNMPTAFREGVPTHRISKVERNTLIMKGPFKFIEVPVRALAAEDEFFRNIIQLSDYYGLAFREAAKAGGGTKKIWQQTKENVANPTSQMVEHSDDYARTIQFLNTPSAFIRSLEQLKHRRPKDGIPLRAAKVGLNLAIPFARVTDNLFRFAARNSPLAVVSPTNWRMLQAGGADRDIAAARIGLGILQGYYVMQKAIEGTITGAGPSDYREREKLMNTGWQPYSIKVGDEWVSYQGFEPASLSVGVMATVAERMAAEDDPDEAAVDEFVRAALTTAEAVTANIGWLESMRNIVSIGEERQGEVNAANMIGGLASSFAVPAAVRQANTAFFDPVQRDTTGDGSLLGRVKGRVQAGIPGLSDDLPARYDSLGRERVHQGAVGPDIASRARISREDTDPVVQEMHRLDVMPNRARRADIKKYFPGKVPAEELQRYAQLAGYYTREDVYDFMNSEEYLQLDDAERAEEIKKIAQQARKDAREELFVPSEGESRWEFVE